MNLEKEEIERIAKLEAELKSIRDVVIKMDTKLDTWNKSFVPRPELQEMLKARDKDIEDIKADLNNLRMDKRNNKAIVPAWAGVVVAFGAMIVTIVGILILR
ncbi:hypothetical protein [Chengkuizengella axinellae]|uniref:DUF1640 domain-containing protein n=1 Tax=Chengkuizengella axinellae TaxID=3064388 RepID=A0ABT9IV69_9BACL|nr:hypothetical protein [Chengkuizengella sp. 2205SS18-9]MDP5273265.1 hypothetical protein [Chengkuizengella sp. 2205SS18-9]